MPHWPLIQAPNVVSKELELFSPRKVLLQPLP